MCPYKYYHVMRQSKDKKILRYQMVLKALALGVKPTARLFNTSAPVVRKWSKRFKTDGYLGLNDRSHKPHYSPGATPEPIKSLSSI
ncbi:MAG: helix-turn-helix domain-containing protein [Candidatus Omnitrophica bacterium]|nr:helix-turn-helix domain-containing protein [Candidatus Omnitrophota bacterium]